MPNIHRYYDPRVYIEFTVNEPLGFSNRKKISLSLCKLMFATLATRLFHSSSLLPIKALLNKTLRGTLLRVCATVAFFGNTSQLDHLLLHLHYSPSLLQTRCLTKTYIIHQVYCKHKVLVKHDVVGSFNKSLYSYIMFD